jgi:hypothetical protein
MSNPLFVVRGLTLALAWLLAVNVAAAGLVVIASRPLMKIDAIRAPRFWLALRLAPAALSLAFVAAVFLPSYWQYEPREPGEGIDLTSIALALTAVVTFVSAAGRGVSAWRRASRRTRAWLQTAQPLTLDGTTVPAFAIDAAPPVMALVGIVRPRLLIARGVLEAFTDEELRASVAHEARHRCAWDNLKRLAMCAAPDVLAWTSTARAIEQQWASRSEHMADREACDSRQARCALASALVKAARLMPVRTPVAEPISTLVGGGEIASRVQRLLDDGVPAAVVEPSPRNRILAALLAAALVAGYAPLLHVVHGATEALIRTLP